MRIGKRISGFFSIFALLVSLEAAGSPNQADAQMLLIDVRTLAEYKTDAVSPAVHIPFQQIGQRIQAYTQGNKAMEIKLYCRSGRRANIALQTLIEQGYTNVKNLKTVAKTTAYLKNLSKN